MDGQWCKDARNHFFPPVDPLLPKYGHVFVPFFSCGLSIECAAAEAFKDRPTCKDAAPNPTRVPPEEGGQAATHTPKAPLQVPYPCEAAPGREGLTWASTPRHPHPIATGGGEGTWPQVPEGTWPGQTPGNPFSGTFGQAWQVPTPPPGQLNSPPPFLAVSELYSSEAQQR